MKSGNGKNSKAPKSKGNIVDATPATPQAAETDAGEAADAQKSAATKSKFLAAQHARFAQIFSQAVAVLMRDTMYRNLPLRELESFLPPIMAGQCIVASGQTTENGPVIPIALAIWARVSPTIDKRLSENLDRPIQLKPHEWTSGDIVWVVVLAGEQRALAGFVKKLCDREFKRNQVKIRVSDKSGKQSVRQLSAGKAAG